VGLKKAVVDGKFSCLRAENAPRCRPDAKVGGGVAIGAYDDSLASLCAGNQLP
jgi:hypothetical protein